MGNEVSEMSLVLENEDHEKTIEEILQEIVDGINLLNARFEETFETGIEKEDMGET